MSPPRISSSTDEEPGPVVGHHGRGIGVRTAAAWARGPRHRSDHMAVWAQGTGGPIPVDDLGLTLMHEHIAIFSPGVREAYPFLFDMDEILAHSVEDLRAAKEAGIGTIVDVTTPDLGRDPRLVADAAAIAGINV